MANRKRLEAPRADPGEAHRPGGGCRKATAFRITTTHTAPGRREAPGARFGKALASARARIGRAAEDVPREGRMGRLRSEGLRTPWRAD